MSKITEEELMFHGGEIKLNWIKKAARKLWQSKIDNYNIKGDNYRQGVIDFMKNECYPLLPEELECIPRDEWDLGAMNGVSKELLYHPHLTKWFEYVDEHLKPRNKVLTVFQCSNQKPYCYVGGLRYYATRWADFTDFATLEYGIVPWDFSNMYPIRWDEWDHFQEDKEMTRLYSEKTKKGILDFHHNHPEYETMIFICQSDLPQTPVNELWDENIDDFRDWAVILTDAEFREELAQEYSHMGHGILIQRTVNTNYTHNRYATALARCYDDPETKAEIMVRTHMNGYGLERRGLYNMYSPVEAKLAYERGVHVCDTQFLNDRKLAHPVKKDLRRGKEKH